jgi:hypothetical protein
MLTQIRNTGARIFAFFLVNGGWAIVPGPSRREATDAKGAEKEKVGGGSRQSVKSAFFGFISRG